ncbi:MULTISPECIES: hypothetical protein [unclassified Phenylobacterium]|uniref:hypothetical protein n=1 Tax=unclassified Phenylobacterium TaxID=2640670 RepID=UPI0012E39C3D|nr:MULTISPECIES: hypothetical protein [unclassified Phenylobacterium]
MKDFAEIAAAWASVGGLVIAVAAGWIALLTYRGQLRHEADTHAHGVIRELLQVTMDPGNDREGVRTFKLYALEEAYDWLNEQRTVVRSWPWRWASSRAAREQALACWEETLKSHLEAYMRQRVNGAEECYGESFRTFVNRFAPQAVPYRFRVQ